jgi:hypothetical protein
VSQVTQKFIDMADFYEVLGDAADDIPYEGYIAIPGHGDSCEVDMQHLMKEKEESLVLKHLNLIQCQNLLISVIKKVI